MKTKKSNNNVGKPALNKRTVADLTSIDMLNLVAGDDNPHPLLATDMNCPISDEPECHPTTPEMGITPKPG